MTNSLYSIPGGGNLYQPPVYVVDSDISDDDKIIAQTSDYKETIHVLSAWIVKIRGDKTSNESNQWMYFGVNSIEPRLIVRQNGVYADPTDFPNGSSAVIMYDGENDRFILVGAGQISESNNTILNIIQSTTPAPSFNISEWGGYTINGVLVPVLNTKDSCGFRLTAKDADPWSQHNCVAGNTNLWITAAKSNTVTVMTNNGFESKELYSYGTTGFDGVLVPVGSSRTCSVDDIVNLDLEVDEDILVDWCVYWDAVNEGLVFKGFKWTDMNTRDKPLITGMYGYLSINTGIRDILVAANRYLGTTRMKRIGTSPDYVLTVEWNLAQRWIYNNYNKVSIAVRRCPIPGTKTALPAGRTDVVYRLCQNTLENTDENTGYKIEWVQGVKATSADPLHAIVTNWSPLIVCTAANVEVNMGINNTTVDPATNLTATYQEVLVGETLVPADNRRLIGQLIIDSSHTDVLEGLNWLHGLEAGTSTSPIYVGQEAGSALWGNIML